MPAGPKNPPARPSASPPPFYEATEDLYIGNPDSGVIPTPAYLAGGRVDPDVVAANGWHHQVRVPDIFAGQYAQPEAPPAPPGQTTALAGKEE